MNVFKKSLLAAGLAAAAFAATTPAMAQNYYRHHDNSAGVAIGAGILGLAVGAIVASNANHDRYYDDGGYYDQGGYAPGWSYRDGYYWDGSGHRFSHDDYVRRNPGFAPGDRNGGFRGGPDRGPNHGQRGDDHRDDMRRGFDRDGGDFRRGY